MSKEDVARVFREKFGKRFVEHEVIAFGSGTTVGKVIELMPDRALEELKSKIIISTSRDTTYRLLIKGLNVSAARHRPEVVVDGADAIIGPYVIKGGGGALLREKIARRLAEERYLVVTKEKLGRYYDVPALKLPDLVPVVMRLLPGAKIRAGGKLPPIVSDDGLAIVDIPHEGTPEALEELMKKLDSYRPIIIEHGIFYGDARIVF